MLGWGRKTVFLRFLWFEDLSTDDEKGCVWIDSQRSFWMQQLKYTVRSVWQGFVFEFLRNLYADDSTLGLDSFDKGYEYFLKVRKIMSDAWFELRKWKTNLVELKEKIYDGIKKTVSDVCVEKKVSGLAWDISKGSINFNFERLVEEAFDLPMTKRSILSISARIYDPLGLLSPITIQMKMLFQIICHDKTSRDTVTEKKLENLW